MLERMRRKANPLALLEGMQIATTTVENSGRFLKKLGIELPCDPIIPPLVKYREKTIIERGACTPVFVAALSMIARTWKQHSCPSTDEWIQKLWYIDTLEYSSALKKEHI